MHLANEIKLSNIYVIFTCVPSPEVKQE